MSEDTQKRRQLARVYMEQQKAKRKERARQRRRQDEEEAVLRREQLEKLDAVRWQRVQESVALAKKSGGHVRSNPDNNREAPSSSSMTELLLGFRTLPPRSKKSQPTYEEDILPLDNDDQITDSAQEEPNLDEDLWSSGDDQNTDEVVESDDGDDGDDRRCAVEVLPRTDPPPPPTSSSPPLLLLKLQALKQLTDQLTSRVGRLSNNNEVDLDDHDGATAQSTRNEERGSVDELDESNDVASSGDDEDAGPPHQHRPDRTAALEASSAPSASWQTPDIHLDAPPEPAPWQRSMDSEDRTPWWEDESESTRHVSSRVVLPPVVHVQSDTRLHQRYANGDGDETRTMTTTMEVHVSRAASLVDGNASSSTEDDDDKQVARWMALRQRRQLGEIRDEAAQVQLHPGHNDKLHSVGYRESPLFGQTSLQSARNHPMGDRHDDDNDDAELDRLIHATRDAYSVVDMYAQQLFQQQQQNRITFELSAATENKDVRALADRFEEIASDTDSRFQDDGRQDMDDLVDSIRWPKDIHTTDEVSSTTAHEDYAHDDDDGPACGGYTGRSIEELLAEASRVLQRSSCHEEEADNNASSFWDRAMRRDDNALGRQVPSSPNRYAHLPRVVIATDDDANLRHSPRTLARQLMAAVDFQESLHEAQMNLSALEYAHEVERNQDETLVWGQAIQDEVDSMAQAQLLLDQHLTMQEEFHQQELVMQAMGHAAQERDKLVEQACQTDQLARRHASTMAQWTVETGTMAVEARDGGAQCTLQHSIAIQSDDRDLLAWESQMLFRDQVSSPVRSADASMEGERHLAINAPHVIPHTLETFETSSHIKESAPFIVIVDSVQSLEVMVKDQADETAYSEGFDSPTKEVSCGDDIPDQDEADKSTLSEVSEVSEDNIDTTSKGFESPDHASVPDDSDNVQMDAPDEPCSVGGADESEEYTEGFDSPPKPTSSPNVPDIDDEYEVDAAVSEVKSEGSLDEIEEAVPSKLQHAVASDVDDDEVGSVVDADIEQVNEGGDSIQDEEGNYSEPFESPRSSKLSSSPRRGQVVQTNWSKQVVHSGLSMSTHQRDMPSLPPTILDKATSQERVEAYFAQLRRRDPEKEEYIRSIVARKASEDKILDMRQRSLTSRPNVSRMQAQAERLQLDSCRAANLARCYEDMMLFRQDEVEDPDEVHILALVFGQSGGQAWSATGWETTQGVGFNGNDRDRRREAPLVVAASDRQTNEEEAHDAKVDSDMDMSEKKESAEEAESTPEEYDEFEEKSVKAVSDEFLEANSVDSATAVNDIAGHAQTKNIVDGLRDSDGNEYSMDDFAATQGEDKSIAVVADVVVALSGEDAMIFDEVNSGHQIDIADEDEYSMDGFSAKQSTDDDDFDEDQEETIGDTAKSVDVASVDEDGDIEGFERPDDACASSVMENEAESVKMVADKDEYAVDDDSTAARVPNADNGDDGLSIDDEDQALADRAVDNIEDEQAVAETLPREPGHEYSTDEFAQLSSPGEIALPTDDEYGSDEFDKSVDVHIADQRSNTSVELQRALDRIATDFPLDIGQDEGKWQRRKAQAMALVAAKERAIAQLKHHQEIKQVNALVAYSLALDIEQEAGTPPSPAKSVVPTMSHVTASVSKEHVEGRSNSPPAAVESVDDASYSDSFENKSDDVEGNAVQVEASDLECEPEHMMQHDVVVVVDPQSSLSRSIDEHELRLAQLKESLASKQEEAVQLNSLLLKEARRAALEAEEIAMRVQLDQTERLVATNQSRLTQLQQQRQDPSPAIHTNITVSQVLESSSVEVADMMSAPASFPDLSETHDPDGSSESDADSSLGDAKAAEPPVLPEANRCGYPVVLELAIVEGDSMSEEDDEEGDQSFASQDDLTAMTEPPPSSVVPMQAEQVVPVPHGEDVGPVRPLVSQIPHVLDASFTSVDGNTVATNDMFVGFDYVEDAAPSNWMHEMATQTTPHDNDAGEMLAMDQFDYIESVDPVVVEMSLPTGETTAKSTDREEEDLLAMYDVVESVDDPQLAADAFFENWEVQYQNLLAGFDHVEAAIAPDLAAIPVRHNAMEHEDTPGAMDLLLGYDVVEVVELHGAALDDASTADGLVEVPSDVVLASEALDEVGDNAEDQRDPIQHHVPSDALNNEHLVTDVCDAVGWAEELPQGDGPPCPSSKDLLANFDYAEDAIPPAATRQVQLPQLASMDLLSSFDFIEVALVPPTPDQAVEVLTAQRGVPTARSIHKKHEPPTDTQVDTVTDLVWKDMLDDVLTKTAAFSSRENAIDSTHSHEVMPADTSSSSSLPAATPVSVLATTTTEPPFKALVDQVTDSLMDELVQESLALGWDKGTPAAATLPPASVSSQPHKQPRQTVATAPTDVAALRNVTYFPDQYSALIQSRQPYDWTLVDHELLRMMEDASASNNVDASQPHISLARPPGVSDSAMHTRRRLLNEWTTINKTSSQNRPILPPPPIPLPAGPLSIKELVVATQAITTKSVSTVVHSLVKDAVGQVSNGQLVDALLNSLLDDTVAEVSSITTWT
ncbi:hypothetical protein DYB31_003024 [Aphanomyces astaci]|uniref:Uncharacterized protein n=3 Tax=Aphanomyces astaci TaxID=112090 RepID=A0A397EUQ9_APHAT|nr:hypothetical protein DYB31_003024 [Aphanomyces astaci]